MAKPNFNFIKRQKELEKKKKKEEKAQRKLEKGSSKTTEEAEEAEESEESPGNRLRARNPVPDTIMPMNPTEPIFEHEFAIRYHELDYRGLLRPVTLLNCVQDAGGMHAALLGVSVRDLRQRGLTWVLSRVHLVADRYLHADDVIRVTTWPSTREGLFSCREFEMRDSTGQLFGRATSSWAALDLASRTAGQVAGVPAGLSPARPAGTE